MNMKWHDPFSKYTEEYLNKQGIWEEYDDEVAEKKKERATTDQLIISNEVVTNSVIGTIEDSNIESDKTIDPIDTPPIVSDEEADLYKSLQDIPDEETSVDDIKKI